VYEEKALATDDGHEVVHEAQGPDPDEPQLSLYPPNGPKPPQPPLVTVVLSVGLDVIADRPDEPVGDPVI